MSQKKRKKGRVKSKAAQATAARRQARDAARAESAPERHAAPDAGRPEMVEFKGGGGMMTRMRGGFQSAVGSADAPAKKKSWLSTAVWILIAIGAVFMFMGSYL